MYYYIIIWYEVVYQIFYCIIEKRWGYYFHYYLRRITGSGVVDAINVS